MTRFNSKLINLYINEPDEHCNICGQTIRQKNYDPLSELSQLAEQRHICCICAFWVYLHEQHIKGLEVIRGSAFIIRPYTRRPINLLQAGYGQEHYIRRFDGTLIKSNNVWYQGAVPDIFRQYFPDTADFLTLMGYQQLLNDPFVCNAKGCFDRYTCFRYNIKADEKQYNTLPANYVPGSENCPSYVTPYINHNYDNNIAIENNYGIPSEGFDRFR